MRSGGLWSAEFSRPLAVQPQSKSAIGMVPPMRLERWKSRLQIVLRSVGTCLRQGGDGDCRHERLRESTRRGRDHVGHGRAERQEPPRREDGRRDFQRQRWPQATAAAEVRLRFSGFLKTVSGPAFPPDQATTSSTRGTAQQRQWLRPRQWHGNGNGNGHHASGTAVPRPSCRARRSAPSFSRSQGVEVTRRLYRSGESEYLIDGHICRLRDVHDLLMDTGSAPRPIRSSAGQDRDDPSAPPTDRAS